MSWINQMVNGGLGKNSLSRKYIRLDSGVDWESQPLEVDKIGQKWQKVNLYKLTISGLGESTYRS